MDSTDSLSGDLSEVFFCTIGRVRGFVDDLYLYYWKHVNISEDLRLSHACRVFQNFRLPACLNSF